MKGRGIIIWLSGMGLLGLMAAYLFTQSNKNKQELDRQGSRNILLVRENLRESLEALTFEIKSLIGYRLILISKSNTYEKQRKAAIFQKRDKFKFKFRHEEGYVKPTFSYEDSLVLSGVKINEIIINIFGDSLNTDTQLDRKGFNDWLLDKKKPLENNQLATSISFTQWMESGLRKSRFFDVVFLANEQGEILYPNFLLGSKVPFPGKSIAESYSYSDVSHFEMDLSAQVYEGYISQLPIGNQILWVGGLKNQEDFNLAAYHINYNLLLVTAMVLLILLLSLPLIAFFDMGKGDVLSKNKVYLIGVSLLVIFIVSGISMSFFIFGPEPLNMEEKRAENVMDSLAKNLDYIQKNLNDSYEPQGEIFKKTLIINEEIEVDKEGNLESLRKDLNDWSDSTYKFNYVNIRHRNYYKYFFQNGDVKKIDPQRGFFLERIFSQKNGDPELVMSSINKDSNQVNAITFKFTDNLINTTNKGYLLIKEDGEVIYSSEKFEFIFTQIKNALPEEKWEKLQALIQSNKEGPNRIWKFPLYLNGKEYTALISMFDLSNTDKPIWFVYLVNTNMYHSLAGMMLVESVIWLFLYGLLLGIISLCKSLLRKSKGYNWKSFTYNSFHPKKITIDNLKLGVVIFIVFSILISLAFFISDISNHLFYSAILCCLFPIFFAIFNRLILQKSSRFIQKISTNLYSTVLFLWFFFIGFVPGFWISAGVFRYESQLWNKIQENSEVKKSPENNKLGNQTKNKIGPEGEIDLYYNLRAGIFSRMDNGFDPQLREMIYPNHSEFLNSVENINRDDIKKQESAPLLILWIPIILFIPILAIAIYILLKKLVRNIYWTDFDLKGVNELGPFIRQKLSDCVDLKIFIYGCDSRKNRDWIHSYLRITLDQIEILDCSERGLDSPLNGLKEKKKKALLVENIHCIEDFKEFIKQYPRFHHSAEGLYLIFSSGISWRNLAANLKEEMDKIRFSELMSDFYFEIVPITFENYGVKVIPNVFREKTMEDYFISTGRYSKRAESPHLRLLLQRYGKAYFYNIWSELSIDEKNVCYAFSMEGFFNYKNKDEVIELYQKGIIVKDEIGGHLHLFSKTFRYFILSIASEEMMGKIMEYRKKKGNSLNTQWALLSFLLVAFGLLSYFDRSFLTELQAIITGVTGISTLVIGEIRRIWISKSS